jgi:putative FmdB family regulatory protein
MPIYEFKCKSCGKKFDLRLSFFFDRDKIKCPECGNGDPEMVISSFSTGCSSSGAESSGHSFG